MTSLQAPAPASATAGVYPMAPLIRFTLVSLYLALVLPLPALAPPLLQPALLLAVPLGLVLVWALTSEQVRLETDAISVGHPAWCRWLLRRGWSLRFDQIAGLTPVGTSQGGRVFYVRQSGGGAYLLPQRIDRFEEFLRRFGASTALDLAGVARLTPPWTYQLLAVLSGLMLSAELVWLLAGWIPA
ncbi:MAG: hypothetical protein FJ060_01705 [Cyanobacteria bacterium K_Offshore_0m_m2_072]|nr:hypothetical protein [Cyanobacteria bacterium K_Offshore_0m_m2_072]